MKCLVLILTIIFFYSCQNKTPSNNIKMNSSTWSFTGGTVGMLGEHKVMFGNIMIQDYTLADGAAREGLTAALSLPNRKKWDLVGVGSTFSLDDITYEVINIEEGDYQGQVTVAKKNN